ncbi:MAG: hypothetical protein MZW92_81325 [Comamonadaceae bacterium]|nr:hypothetical protein [Comamonadaceae bacterium]
MPPYQTDWQRLLTPDPFGAEESRRLLDALRRLARHAARLRAHVRLHLPLAGRLPAAARAARDR